MYGMHFRSFLFFVFVPKKKIPRSESPESRDLFIGDWDLSVVFRTVHFSIPRQRNEAPTEQQEPWLWDLTNHNHGSLPEP